MKYTSAQLTRKQITQVEKSLELREGFQEVFGWDWISEYEALKLPPTVVERLKTFLGNVKKVVLMIVFFRIGYINPFGLIVGIALSMLLCQLI